MPTNLFARLRNFSLSLLILCSSIGLLPAEQFGKFTYRLIPGGIEITYYPTTEAGEVVIPAEIDGKPVIRIGISAFSDCRELTRVTIAASVTSIQSMAFARCRSLAAVTLPPGLTSIGNNAFEECAMAAVTLPVGLTSIGSAAFDECNELVTITIPASVTSIGVGAFRWCRALTAITVEGGNPNYVGIDGVLFNYSQTRLLQFPAGKSGDYAIPDGVTSIGDSAFGYCAGLTGITIPASVTSIGWGAFLWCVGLTSVTVPANVTSIGSQAFDYCLGLTVITVDAGNPAFSSMDGVLFNRAQTMLIQRPAAKAGAYAIPDGVTQIGSKAFDFCQRLTSVSIPASVTSIGSGAFSQCTDLTSVTLPDSVKSIETEAFSYCSGLTSAAFLGNAPSMGWGVFDRVAVGFTVYYIPGGTGFTTPIWQGYPALPLATTREIGLIGPGGAELDDGGPAIAFGEVYRGAVERFTFTIRNFGATNLTGLSISKNGAHAPDFTVSTLEASTLNPGAGATFTVTFAPGAAGTRTAAIQLASNDADESPFDLQLTGVGLDRVAPFHGSRRIASTVNEDDELAIGMALDSQGNCHVTGWFDGTNDFGGVLLTNTSGGGQDLFVGKYNSAGVLQWARRAGGNTAGRDAGRGIGVDNAGNVYVTGGFSGTADFGSFTQTTSLRDSFFLAKYNSAGTVQWVRQNVGGTFSTSAYGTGLAVDGDGNSYAVGYYDGDNVTFETTTLPTPTDYQCFLVKYDSAGSLQWAKPLAATGMVYSTEVALDSGGNVCVGGTFSGSMTLGAPTLASAGGRDVFLAKFSSAGMLEWVRQAGGADDDMGDGGVAVDAADNIWFVGGFGSNSIDFNGTSLTNAGDLDAFIAKYNNAGILQWVRRAGGADLDFYWTVAVDAQGNAYAAGAMGASSAAPTGTGGAVVVKYDTNGTRQWDYSVSGPPAGPVASIAAQCAVDSSGDCHLAGWYQGTATFGTTVLQPQGYWNYFLTRIPADGFAGVFPGRVWEYNDNIRNLKEEGIAQRTDIFLDISQNDPSHHAVELSDGSESLDIPNLMRIGNRLQLATRPMNMETWNLLDFIMLSDGTNRSFAMVGQESYDATDISITLSSWSAHLGTVTVDDFVGTWAIETYNDPNLLDTSEGFSYERLTAVIQRIDSDHIQVQVLRPGGAAFSLRVSGDQAFLETAPVIAGNTRYHTFRISTDGQKMSFHFIASEIDDWTDVSVGLGLGVKQAPALTTWLVDNGFPADADLQSDPNGDGVSLLLAYALDLDPHENLAGRMPKPVLEAGNQLTLTFHAASPGITYAVETSTDLRTWTTEGVFWSALAPDHTRTATVDRLSPVRFLRLVVSD